MWIRVDDDVIEHPKTYRLARILGTDRAAAVGLLTGIWGYAKRHHPDGDLTNCELSALHAKLGFTSNSVRAASAIGPHGVRELALRPVFEDVREVLAEAGFMDVTDGPPGRQYLLHDWDDYNGPDLETRKEERQRAYLERRLRAQPGYVYYAVATDQHRVKIGYSSNPWARVSEMRTSVPALQLGAVEPGSPYLETQRQAEFDEYHVEREWFAYAGRLEAHVRRLSERSGKRPRRSPSRDGRSDSERDERSDVASAAGARLGDGRSDSSTSRGRKSPPTPPSAFAPPPESAAAVVARVTGRLTS